MSYYLSRSCSQPFDSVLAELIESLKREGFGVLSDIDVQATLKAKLGAQMPRYRILGACNPRLAHQALQLETRLGVLLPCNVIVREQPTGDVEVAAIDPVASMGRTDNPALRPLAEQVRAQLAQALERLSP